MKSSKLYHCPGRNSVDEDGIRQKLHLGLRENRRFRDKSTEAPELSARVSKLAAALESRLALDCRDIILNDSELVQGLRRRDPAAMQWLCDCYLPSLWRFIYIRVDGDTHLAEDITSETILAMLTTIQSDNNPGVEILNPIGWLRTVAGRRVSDHFRAVARVRHVIEEVAGSQPGSDEADPAKYQELQETRSEVRQVMDDLPEQHRLALEWKYLDKLSVREMAARWGTTEKAAESILFRARRDFRDRLARTAPNESSCNGKRSAQLNSARDNVPKENASHKVK